jgi:hypothetical protein
MPTIDIVKKVAEELVAQASNLFLHGAGIPIDQDENYDPAGMDGIIDDLDGDSETFRWANAVLMFLRFVKGVLNNAIERGDLIEAADILTGLDED